ncbi:hypothetical protein ACCS83_36825, partial [Rhizobium johnstonii]|uniref:hypothetical protein n=1 Tax=Rhizobium johnstonii TaxID=3019933 RepID=UPI003F9497BB
CSNSKCYSVLCASEKTRGAVGPEVSPSLRHVAADLGFEGEGVGFHLGVRLSLTLKAFVVDAPHPLSANEGKNHMAHRPKATYASRKHAAIYSPRSRRFLGPSCNFGHTKQLPVE